MDYRDIENEIFAEFEGLSNYDEGCIRTYSEAQQEFNIEFEDRLGLSVVSDKDKWQNLLMDKKLNELINSNEAISWKEVQKIYDWSPIKSRYKVVIDPWSKEWEKARKVLHTVFHDESICQSYFIDRYYDGALKCPKCNCDHIYRVVSTSSKGRFRCSKCLNDFSLTSKTMIGNTKLPLRTWYSAVYLLTSIHGEAMTTAGLSRSIGITQKTGWHLCQKIKSNIGSEFLRKMNKGLFEYKGGIIYPLS